MSGALLWKGFLMDENQLNKLIGYAIILLFTSLILQMLTPILMWAVGILIVVRIMLAFNQHK
jgi:hypothetical protein